MNTAMQQDVCKRNCWIAGTVVGLIVLIVTGSGIGLLGAVIMGVIAALLSGGLLQWLLCSGHSGDSAGDHNRNDAIEGRDVGMDRHADAGPEGTVITGSGSDERTVAPVGTLAPPAGIVAGALQTMSDGAVLARTGSGQAPTFGKPASGTAAPSPHSPQPSATPAPIAGGSPLEDTRSVMAVPSQSEHHDMPGEAVPAAEPDGAQDDMPPNGATVRKVKAPKRDKAAVASGDDAVAGPSKRKRGGKIRVTGGDDGGPAGGDAV